MRDHAAQLGPQRSGRAPTSTRAPLRFASGAHPSVASASSEQCTRLDISGTPCTVSVIVEKRRPISYVLPLAKKAVDLGMLLFLPTGENR